jgi:diaminopimelate epimerase
VVLEADPERLTPALARRICDRHFGIGSDGILLPTRSAPPVPFGLRIVNPDGSEAEKSGNGLRIFARYLWDQRIARVREFRISTPGGEVTAHLLDDQGTRIAMDMGRLSFDSRKVPVAGPPREVLDEEVSVLGETVRINAVTIGNPHCVVFVDRANAALARKFGGLGRELALAVGPELEKLPLYPARTNVQFVEAIDRHTLRMEIWERGAGYTLASGSSSCAAVGAAIRTGRCESPVTVRMPGGEMLVEVADDWSARLTGTVDPVCVGELTLPLP